MISQIDYRSVYNNLDGEPDIFSLNLPGISLKFLYNNEGEIYTLSQSNVDIRFHDEYTDEDGTYENIFLVTDPNGVKYLFKPISLTYYYYFPENTCDVEEISEIYTSWHLTKMTSHDNVDYIKFIYEKNNSVTLTKGKHFTGYDLHLSFLDPEIDPIDINIVSKYEQLTNKVLISTIETKREEINFNFIQSNATYSTCYPTNNYNKNYFLNKIIVKDKQNKKIKELALNYTGSHLKKIQEINPNNETDKLPPYRFNYISGGMLGEVHYPAGGYTKFEYENNSYFFPTDINDPWHDERWNTYLDENNPGVDKNNIAKGGYRVKRITKHNSGSSLVTDFSYLNDDGYSSGRLLNYPIKNYNWIIPGNPWNPKYADVSLSYDLSVDKGYVLYNTDFHNKLFSHN